MKIRKGFVSNSSSSSFIIVCNSEKELKLILSKYEEFKEFYKKIIDYDDIEENLLCEVDERYLKDFFVDYYKYSDQKITNNMLESIINNFINEIKEGKKLLITTVSDETNFKEYKMMNMFLKNIMMDLKDENGNKIGAYIKEELRGY